MKSSLIKIKESSLIQNTWEFCFKWNITYWRNLNISSKWPKEKSIPHTPPVQVVAVDLIEKDVFQESFQYGLFCDLAEKQLIMCKYQFWSLQF